MFGDEISGIDPGPEGSGKLGCDTALGEEGTEGSRSGADLGASLASSRAASSGLIGIVAARGPFFALLAASARLIDSRRSPNADPSTSWVGN